MNNQGVNDCVTLNFVYEGCSLNTVNALPSFGGVDVIDQNLFPTALKQASYTDDEAALNIGGNVEGQSSEMDTEEGLREKIESAVRKVDLYSPPGIAGEICEAIAEFEKRELKELRPVSAMTLISAICKDRTGFNTRKLNLMFLASAETAYGKEAHQDFIKICLVAVGQGGMMSTDPRSDKSFYVELAKTGGSLYIIDEAHTFFEGVTSGKASTHEAAMMGMILKLNTSGLLLFPGTIKKEILNEFKSAIEILTNKEALSSSEEEELEFLHHALSLVASGWPTPYVGLVAFSTPDNLNNIVQPEHMASGLIGRFIYLRSSGKAGNLTNDPFLDPKPDAKVPEELIARLRKMKESDDEITLSKDARQLLSLTLRYLELDSVRNHRKLGALYRRGVERISQICSLLAMEKGEITAEMASYAIAMFFEHVKVCEEILDGVSKKHDEMLLNRVRAVVQDILRVGPVQKGLVANKLVKRCAEIREKRETHKRFEYVILEKLVDANILIEKEGNYALAV